MSNVLTEQGVLKNLLSLKMLNKRKRQVYKIKRN